MTKPAPKPLIERLIPWAIAVSVLLFALDGKLVWDQQHQAAAPVAAAHG